MRARHTSTWETSIHDVEILAYSDTGEKVCRKHIGDLLELEEPEKTVSLTCGSFPAIITADAEESPCDGALISIFRWKGTENEKDHPNDPGLWDQDRRECDEGLPSGT